MPAHNPPLASKVAWSAAMAATRKGFRHRLTVAIVVAVLLCAWLGSPPALLAADDVFTPEHVARLRAVAAAKIAPDGEDIACVLRVPRQPFEDEDGPAWSELHVVDQQGRSRPFVTGEVNVSAIAWTPDGSGISFLAKRGEDEHRSLYVIALAGGEARQILAQETDIQRYTWSPDGKRVAFTATKPPPKDSKELKEKGFSQEVYEEDWQPLKVWIAAVKAADETGDKDVKPRALELKGSASEIHWSPRGHRLAVALAPTPLVDDSYMNRRLAVVDPERGRVRGRYQPPGKMGAFAWSPDGRRLAVISSADRHDPAAGRLVVVSEDGGQGRDVLPDLKGHVTSVAWGNEETILYLADVGVYSLFGEVRHDGSGTRTAIPVEQKMVLRDFDHARTGSATVFVSDSPQHPAEVFLRTGDRRRPKQLTHSNSWLPDLRMASQEVISYPARDGLRLEGVLIRPLDQQAGQRYPLILAVHGGPEAHISDGWLTSYAYPGQVAAARGFAVFYPNYRGSTGRGVEFSKLGHGDAAGKEFDDLVDAVDHLVEMGLVEKDRVGITGGSYGGYASAWGATYYSERFAASVMFVGISDTLSKAGTTDIPEEMYLVHQRKRIWDDWEFFLERSPIRHIEKARTPTLILHGKNDPRVHPSQSLEFYRLLKLQGKAPVRLVLYPGEGHGNRRAASRYDYSLRMLRWMEHYLKGPGGPPPAYEVEYPLGAKSEGSGGDIASEDSK